MLGDGAKWIWNLATEYFPDAIQIVDRFHAKQHLSDVAKAVWGATGAEHKPWAEARHDELDAGKIDAMLAALAPHVDAVKEAREYAEYVRSNRYRMRYAEFHAAGLCTSTGVVEAGCKTGDWHPLQACRDALDRQRRQRHHRSTLLQALWPLRGLLGTAFKCPRCIDG